MERSRSVGGGRENTDSVLSRRGYRIMSRGNILNDGAIAYRLDRYDSNTNPSGIINLGTSENKISVDMMAKRLAQPDMFHIDPITLCYGDWKGHHFLKEEMARFLTDYCRAPAPLDPENVVVVNGCGSLFTALSAVLCDDGDGILIPTPYYGVIDNDLRYYSGVQTVHVPLYSKMESGETYPFQLTVPKLEAALTSAQDKEIRVRGLILINPHNPLGDIYPADDLMSYLQFAKRHKLHVIMDEIYMLTIFKEGVEFTSVLSFDCLPDPSRTHVMWSLSKDFAASGLRIGVLHTCNSEVIQALGKIAYVHGVPGPLQSSVAQLLRDREWIDHEFLPTNRARLLAAHTYMAGRLRSMGVPYLDRASGLYIWANFQQFLKEPTFEAEVELWRALIQAKVLISHGQAFLCPEPGWVRLVFSEKQQSLHLGMDRLEKALCNIKAKLSESVKVTSVKEIQVNAASNGVPHESFDSVEALIGQLQDQIQKSDWLSQNTAEDFALANPEVCVAFKKAAQE